MRLEQGDGQARTPQQDGGGAAGGSGSDDHDWL
jgi:hypothetical protein